MVETSRGSLVTIFLKSLKSKVGSQIIRDSRPRKCKNHFVAVFLLYCYAHAQQNFISLKFNREKKKIDAK